MRALTFILPLLLLALCAIALSPDAAAATTSTGAGSAAFLGTGIAALGAGIVVNLSAKKTADDGTVSTQSFNLDSEGDAAAFGTQLTAYGEAKVEEGASPLRLELAAAQAERDAYRDAIVDEILRVQTLAATDAEGNVSDDFDADEQRTYLCSLPPKTLAIHAKKARETTVSLKAQTSGETPKGEGGDDAAFGHVTVG